MYPIFLTSYLCCCVLHSITLSVFLLTISVPRVGRGRGSCCLRQRGGAGFGDMNSNNWVGTPSDLGAEILQRNAERHQARREHERALATFRASLASGRARTQRSGATTARTSNMDTSRMHTGRSVNTNMEDQDLENVCLRPHPLTLSSLPPIPFTLLAMTHAQTHAHYTRIFMQKCKRTHDTTMSSSTCTHSLSFSHSDKHLMVCV